MRPLQRSIGVAALLILLLGVAAYTLSVGAAARRLSSTNCRLTAFMYHAVVADEVPAARYRIPESSFAAQMDALARAGARTPHLDEVTQVLHGSGGGGEGCPFGPRDVLITFDMDGAHQRENLALPHLVRNGFTAIFFVPTGSIDGGGSLVTLAALRKLGDAGMTIGSHTERHRDMRTEASDSMIASLQRTRETLTSLTGQAITSVAAPGGRYDARVIRDVERAGFSTFFNSDPCHITLGTSPYQMCRIEIRGDGGMTPVQALDRPLRVALQATNWRAKRAVERLVGGQAFGILSRVRSRLAGDDY